MGVCPAGVGPVSAYGLERCSVVLTLCVLFRALQEGYLSLLMRTRGTKSSTFSINVAKGSTCETYQNGREGGVL